MFKRIVLFLATNLAVLLVLSIVLRLLGVDRILDESGNLQSPVGEPNIRLFAQIQNGPVLHQVLTDGYARHAVPINWAASLGPEPLEPYVHRLLV